MNMNLPSFLEQDSDGFVQVAGHRIGFQHLVHYYNEGFSPETLACEYPSLLLAEIHKVIAFYLENRSDVDLYVTDCQAHIESQRRSAEAGPTVAELRQRLQESRTVKGI
jgi:uncharacterized protein (DUF433 family)